MSIEISEKFGTLRELKNAIEQVPDYMLDLPFNTIVEGSDDFGLVLDPEGDSKAVSDVTLEGGRFEAVDIIEEGNRVTSVRLCLDSEDSKLEKW